MSDAVSRKVEKLLRDGFDAAHPRRPRVTPEMILDLCGCSHESGSHHGPDGLGRCGEDGCDCLGWHPTQAECPDCGDVWESLEAPCPRCGMTIEQVAERLSR